MQIIQGPSMAAVEALLRENNLPVEDLSALRISDFLYCGQAETPQGIIGLQVVETVGLVRSLVVSETGRQQGCGTALVAALETKAIQEGIFDLYLLTETAVPFFAKLNYTAIPRVIAPSAIKNTREFTTLCPDDATLMNKKLVMMD